MYTDYALAIVYITGEDLYFGAWTLAIVVVPSLLISLFTFILHKKSKGQFLMKVYVSRPVVYTLCALLHGHVARCLMWLKLLVKKETLFGVRKVLWAFRDITSYAETFIHSLPQLCLQLYVMVIYTGHPTPLQYISFVSSLISAAWAIQSQFNGLKWKLLSFEINLCWFASRATATFMIASVNKAAPFLLLIVHLLLMFPLWFYQNNIQPCRKKRGTTRFELIFTDVFYAGIYAASNTVTPITCKYQLPLAFILLAENFICIGLGFKKGKVLRPIDYFQKHRKDYNDYYLKNSTLPNYCKYDRHGLSNFNGTESVDSRYCLIDFRTWNQSSITVFLACSVTVLGFIQVLIVVLLRYRKVIDEEAMVSKLGSFGFRKNPSNKCKENGNNDNKPVVVTTTTSVILTPKTSPVAVTKKQNKNGRKSDVESSPCSGYNKNKEYLNIENITFEKGTPLGSYSSKDGSQSSGGSLLSHFSESPCDQKDEFSNLYINSDCEVIEDITFEKRAASPFCSTHKDGSKSCDDSVCTLPVSHSNNIPHGNENNSYINKDGRQNSDDNGGMIVPFHSNNNTHGNEHNSCTNKNGSRNRDVNDDIRLMCSHDNNITNENENNSDSCERTGHSTNSNANNVAEEVRLRENNSVDTLREGKN